MRCPTLNDLPTPPTGKTGWPWTEESEQLPDTMPDGSSWPRVSIVTPSYNRGRCGSAHQDTRLEIRDLNYLNKEAQSNGSNLH
jgi:hypothetical protein